MAINWVELNPAERQRTYHFPGGEDVTVKGVCKLEIRKSGVHRYETTDGGKGFIAAGWLSLEIHADAWTC